MAPKTRNKGNKGKSLNAAQRRLMKGSSTDADRARINAANRRAMKAAKRR